MPPLKIDPITGLSCSSVFKGLFMIWVFSHLPILFFLLTNLTNYFLEAMVCVLWKASMWEKAPLSLTILSLFLTQFSLLILCRLFEKISSTIAEHVRDFYWMVIGDTLEIGSPFIVWNNMQLRILSRGQGFDIFLFFFHLFVTVRVVYSLKFLIKICKENSYSPRSSLNKRNSNWFIIFTKSEVILWKKKRSSEQLNEQILWKFNGDLGDQIS